uniref:AI-2E family transporter n=1 Tax=Leptospirillum ferriphilum TaxID=178606 RepID=A0A7C3QVE3_9BACT
MPTFFVRNPKESGLSAPLPSEETPSGSHPTSGRPFIAMALFLSLFGLLYLIISPYLSALLWAAILSFAIHPIYSVMLRKTGRPAWTALLTTFLFLAFVMAPLLSLGVPLSHELILAIEGIRNFLMDPHATVPDWIARLPVIGPRINALLVGLKTHPIGLDVATAKLQTHILAFGNQVLSLATNLGKWFLEFFIFLLAFFAFTLHGETIWHTLSRLFTQWAGPRMTIPLKVIPATTRGVLYGVFFTALFQAILSAIGFWAAGLPNVLLLTTMAFLAALFPVGAVVVWVPSLLYLAVMHHWVATIAFGIWNLLGGGIIEHFVKPIFIGRSSDIPFLAILLGVMGGLEAFGLIGLFIGPVVLSVTLALLKALASSSPEV